MIGVAEITRRLPYRYPMLLVDRVVEVVPGESLTALKAVTATEPWFDGPCHRAAGPVCFPPVLLMESLCQAAGLLAAWDSPRPSVLSGEVMLLGSLSDVSIHRPVEPGCVVRHQVRLVRDLTHTLIFTGMSSVDDHTVLRVGQMIMAIRPSGLVTSRSPSAAAALAGARDEPEESR